MAVPVLSRRALGRATLARQQMLERAPADDGAILHLVEHLGGLQAQTPHTWYVGFWSRLDGVRPEQVSGLLESRDLVRIALMRSTIHLVSARDAVAFRPLLEPMLVRAMTGNWGKHLVGVDPAELAAAGRGVLDEQPLPFSELGRRLAEQWPDRDPDSLAQGVRAHAALAQVTPRGLWGRSGKAAHAPLESWVGPVRPRTLTVDQLVLRYLGAFGPASVKDAQVWSGLTRLSEVFERLRDELVVLADEDGRELFDLPDAPRPGEDVPAPVRLMYDYDNLFLSHADRSRVVSDAYREIGGSFSVNGMQPRLVMVDGSTRGHWTYAREGDVGVLTVQPFAKRFTKKEQAAVVPEALSLAGFLDGAATPDVRFVDALQP